MPGLLSVNDFVDETKDDFNSPTTSTFAEKISLCRQTVSSLEENLDIDRDWLVKMKKALKAIQSGGNDHIDNQVYYSKSLEKLGVNAMSKDQESDIGAAFIKFSIVTKELSALMKTLMQNLNNIVMYPIDNILKGDLKEVKGDLRKPFEKAWRDYESKMAKIEKEKKHQAKEAGFIKTEISASEIAEETEKERKIFQLQMCEYLIKVNEIKTKKGVELLQHLVDYYHAQTNYFQDGLKTIEHFSSYITELSTKIINIKANQDEERKRLLDLKNLLSSSSPFLEGYIKDTNSITCTAQNSCVDRRESKIGYSLHQLQGNKDYGTSKSGYLSKKSEGKMKVKAWKKRKCEVVDGYLYIYHSDESKPPTEVKLLTCQVKNVPSERKCFDLVSSNRTYHFQTDDENDTEAWVSVFINNKEKELKKQLDCNATVHEKGKNDGNGSLLELRQSIINQVLKLSGNEKCVDCGSSREPSWLSTNFGVLLCIECSGIHRELGVHVSRIQSLILDNIGTSQLLIARVMSNATFNSIMEATLEQNCKLTPSSSMEERCGFIRAKYIDKKFALHSYHNDINDLKNDLEKAIVSRDIFQLLQAFVQGSNLSWVLPSFERTQETSLHVSIAQEEGNSLHIVDFLVQNGSDLMKPDRDGNTPLHYAVIHNQSECMKLLLRSGADPRIENKEAKTPLHLAKEKGLLKLIKLLEGSIQNKKGLFDNVNIDWKFNPVKDASNDFSDDDLGDDKLITKDYYEWLISGNINSTLKKYLSGIHSDTSSSIKSRKHSLSFRDQALSSDSFSCDSNQQISSIDRNKPRSRPSSVVGSESSCNKFIDGSSVGTKKMNTFLGQGGNIRKKGFITLSSKSSVDDEFEKNDLISTSMSPAKYRLSSHIRTISDSGGSNCKSFSSDEGTDDKHYSTLRPKPLQSVYSGESPTLRTRCQGLTPSQLPNIHQRVSNGQSTEGISSSEVKPNISAGRIMPVPPPRRRHDIPTSKYKRCRAAYDCNADRDDELAFKEGEIIIVVSEKTDEEEWMEGYIEGDAERKGVFPANFVQMLED